MEDTKSPQWEGEKSKKFRNFKLTLVQDANIEKACNFANEVETGTVFCTQNKEGVSEISLDFVKIVKEGEVLKAF